MGHALQLEIPGREFRRRCLSRGLEPSLGRDNRLQRRLDREPGERHQNGISGPGGGSPAGTFEQNDMDNWKECTQTCRGVMSRRVPVNNQMGLGHERFDPALGAWTSDYGFSESNHRQFYGRWAELMANGTAAW